MRTLLSWLLRRPKRPQRCPECTGVTYEVIHRVTGRVERHCSLCPWIAR